MQLKTRKGVFISLVYLKSGGFGIEKINVNKILTNEVDDDCLERIPGY